MSRVFTLKIGLDLSQAGKQFPGVVVFAFRHGERSLSEILLNGGLKLGGRERLEKKSAAQHLE